MRLSELCGNEREGKAEKRDRENSKERRSRKKKKGMQEKWAVFLRHKPFA